MLLSHLLLCSALNISDNPKYYLRLVVDEDWVRYRDCFSMIIQRTLSFGGSINVRLVSGFASYS